MKKKIAIVLVIMTLLVAALGLVACDKTAPTPVTVTIYIGEQKFENIKGYSNENLFNHLLTICEANKLAINYTGTSFGAFLNEIGSLKASGTQFISIFTSDVDSKDLTEYCTTITKNEVTLYTSGLGASNLKLIDGGVYAFELVTF